MPKLSNPTLKIELSNTSQANITASVKVAFDSFEENLIKNGLKFKLRSRLWGDDQGSVTNGDDDPLFWLPSKTITADGTYTFTATVNRSSLDEDWEGNDEIYARFTCSSTTPGFPMNAKPVVSDPPIHGNF